MNRYMKGDNKHERYTPAILCLPHKLFPSMSQVKVCFHEYNDNWQHRAGNKCYVEMEGIFLHLQKKTHKRCAICISDWLPEHRKKLMRNQTFRQSSSRRQVLGLPLWINAKGRTSIVRLTLTEEEETYWNQILTWLIEYCVLMKKK